MKNFSKNVLAAVRRNQKEIGLFLFLMGVASHSAMASTGSAGLPWEGPLMTVKDSLTGPVALGISTCALFACGATLVFGGEMTEFVKRALYAVVAISFIVGGASFMTTVFGFSGAHISLLNNIDHISPMLNRTTLAQLFGLAA